VLGDFRASLRGLVLRFDDRNIELAFMAQPLVAQGCVGAERLCVTLSEQPGMMDILDARLREKIIGTRFRSTLKMRTMPENQRKGWKCSQSSD
jgi:hypothetical protein